MLKEAIINNINGHYDIASKEIGIGELVLKGFIEGNAKIDISKVEMILNYLNIKIDESHSKKIETSLTVLEPEDTNIFKYYAVYWLKKKKFEIKDSTYCNYANLLKNQIIPVMGDIKLKDLNGEILQLFIYKAQSENNLATKTTKDCLGVIKQIITEGQEEGVIPLFVYGKRKLKFKKQENIENTKKVYTEDEYKKIINEILKEINYTKIGILLGIYTGMRIGELCALQFQDIDYTNNIITINKTLQRIYDPTNDLEPSRIVITSTKTSNSTRTVPITNEIAKILKKLDTGKENYITTGKKKYTEPRTFRKKYQSFMEKINIEPLKFHSLRHTFASINIENGADIKTISSILGHSDIDTTLKIYTHTSEKSKEKAINKFEKLLRKKNIKYDCKYKGYICCINKRTAKLDFIGTIKDVAEYIGNTSVYVCNCINLITDDKIYNIIPKIEGITHKNDVYVGG